MVDLSIVIATCNQRERLRVVLAGLERQNVPGCAWEVVVVTDGCTDGTDQMLARWRARLPLRVVQLPTNQGRCRARNAGVEAARGELVGFLDGDALPHPGWLVAMWEAVEEHGERVVLCGAEYSIEDLEYVEDPGTGEPMGGETPSVVREWVRQRSEELRITEEMVATRFGEIEARSVLGGYPFPELREVQRQTQELFELAPDNSLGWIGFYPHNGLVGRAAFLEAGGFDEEISFCEGWEMAYSVRARDPRLHYGFVPDAHTYHLYHVHPFADKAERSRETKRRRDAIEHMARKHCDARLLLIHFWNGAIWPDPLMPRELLLQDLVDFLEVYDASREAPEILREYVAVCERHPQIGTGEGSLSVSMEMGTEESRAEEEGVLS